MARLYFQYRPDPVHGRVQKDSDPETVYLSLPFMHDGIFDI